MTCGPFVLGAPLGAGGMSEVFEARHRRTGAAVAIKVTQFGERETLRKAFAAEISSMARVYHPNIVQIFDWGSLADGTGNWCAMALSTEGTLSTANINNWSQLKTALRDILLALAHAHARDIIHRDLKPANVLRFLVDGRLEHRLADFGLAYSQVIPDEALAREIAGTPAFMSTEQLHGRWREFGPWTDLYALGCIAFELATGRLPYWGTSPLAIAMAQLNAPIPPLEPNFPVPAEFQAWVHSLLEPDWRQRPQRAAVALAQLDSMAAPKPQDSRDHGAPSQTMPDYELATATLVLDPTLLAKTLIEQGVDASAPFGPIAAVSPQKSEVGPPGDWRTEVTLPRPFSDTGLGLFGLRETGLVGHESVRDNLWRIVRRTASDTAPRAAILSGATYRERRSVTRWFRETLDEITSLTTITIDLESRNQGRDPFMDLIQTFATAWGLSGESLRRHLARSLRRVSVETGDWIERVARVIETQDATSLSQLEGISVCSMFIRRLVSRGPVVLFIEGLQDEPGAWFMVERFLSMGNEPLVFVLNTTDEDWVKSIPENRVRARATGLVIEPLDSESARRVLDSYVRLDPESRDHWAQMVVRDRGVALDALRFSISVGALEPGPMGFHVAAPHPRSADELIGLRLRHLAEQSGPLKRWVTSAAAVGSSMSLNAWFDVAKTIGVDTDIEGLEVLMRHEFIADTRQGYALKNEGVRRALITHIGAADARALLAAWPSPGQEAERNKAQLQFATGSVEAAAETLVSIARRDTDDARNAAWIALSRQVANALEHGHGEEEQLAARKRRGPGSKLQDWITVMEGRLRSTAVFLRRGDTLREILEHTDVDPDARLELEYEYLVTRCFHHDLDGIREDFDALLGRLKTGPPILRGKVLATLGWFLTGPGHNDLLGRRKLQEAIVILEQHESWTASARPALHLSISFANENDHASSLISMERSIEFANRSGDISKIPDALLERSALYRLLGRKDACLQDARDAFEYGLWAAADRHSVMAANLAIALGGHEQFSAGHQLIDDTLRLATSGPENALLQAAHAVLFALRNDTQGWDQHLQNQDAASANEHIIQIASDAWKGRGDETRSQQALKL